MMGGRPMQQQLDGSVILMEEIRASAMENGALGWEWQAATQAELRIQQQALLLYAKGYGLEKISRFLSREHRTLVDVHRLQQMVDGETDHLAAWMGHALQPSYAFIHVDEVSVYVMKGGRHTLQMAYILIGIDERAQKDLLGIWLARGTAALFWERVFVNLRERGVQRISFVAGNGIEGLERGLAEAFPTAGMQCCLTRLQYESLQHVAAQHRQGFCQDAWRICTADNPRQAEEALGCLRETWGQYPQAVALWEEAVGYLIERQRLPLAVRQTASAIHLLEGYHSVLMKVLRDRSPFQTEGDALKALFWRALEGLATITRSRAAFNSSSNDGI